MEWLERSHLLEYAKELAQKDHQDGTGAD